MKFWLEFNFTLSVKFDLEKLLNERDKNIGQLIILG